MIVVFYDRSLSSSYLLVRSFLTCPIQCHAPWSQSRNKGHFLSSNKWPVTREPWEFLHKVIVSPLFPLVCIADISKLQQHSQHPSRRTFRWPLSINTSNSSQRRTLSHKMPCVRPIARQHRHFLPHLPPGTMRCQFSPEMVSPLPHAMMHVFAELETDTTRSPISPPPSPLTPTASSSSLIPKPSGEVSRVGRGGYTLKDVLEQEHEWENGLYHKIRVYITRS